MSIIYHRIYRLLTISHWSDDIDYRHWKTEQDNQPLTNRYYPALNTLLLLFYIQQEIKIT